jgi:DegV family protein with EDD domain
MKTAAEELNSKYDNKIYVVDSKCACLGEGLLVMLVSDYAQTHTIKECVAYADDVKNRLIHLFTVDTLKYPAAGGRVSKATAMVGNILKIKPVLCVDEDGHLVAKTKVIGRKASLHKLIEKTVEKFTGESDYLVISHADCAEDADYVANALAQKLNVKIIIGEIGHVIGGHSGPGTLAVYFLGKDRTF